MFFFFVFPTFHFRFPDFSLPFSRLFTFESEAEEGRKETMMDATVKDLFDLGFSQHEVCTVLSMRFGYNISTRQLRRVLARLHLYRRKNFTDINEVIEFVKRQLARSGQLHGQGSNFTTATTANAVTSSAFAVMPFKFGF